MCQVWRKKWKQRAPAWCAARGRDKDAQRIFTGGTVDPRIRRLLKVPALPLAPSGRTPGLSSAPPSAAGPSGGCSFREAGLRGPPPGHVGGGGSQNGARGQMFAIPSAQPFPYLLAVNGLKSPHIQLNHTIPPLSTDKFLEKISLNLLSPLPSSSTQQLLPPQKVVLLPPLMSSNLSFRHHLTLLDIITYFLTLFRFSFFLSGHSPQSPSTILFLTCFLNISVHKNSWRTLIFKCPTGISNVAISK